MSIRKRKQNKSKPSYFFTWNDKIVPTWKTVGVATWKDGNIKVGCLHDVLKYRHYSGISRPCIIATKVGSSSFVCCLSDIRGETTRH